DILHVHTPKASFLGGIAGRLSLQKNIVYHMHGLVSSKGNEISSSLLYYFEKITCTLATKIFAVSHSLKEFAIEGRYCNPNKIEVLANGTVNGIDWKDRFNPKKIQAKN